jgi:hypothetical protein
MLSQTAMLSQLDERLRNVITSPNQSGDRAALLFVLEAVNKSTPTKRNDVWTHFERKLGHGLGNHVTRMRVIYDDVAAQLTETPGAKRLAAIKAKARERGLL